MDAEAKLCHLKDTLKKEGLFDDPKKRLLIFTEFKDTLDYLTGNSWSGGSGVARLRHPPREARRRSRLPFVRTVGYSLSFTWPQTDRAPSTNPRP